MFYPVVVLLCLIDHVKRCDPLVDEKKEWPVGGKLVDHHENIPI